MCDYSLEYYTTRKAVEGECLVVKTFPTSSKGLVSKQACGLPVCVTAGTAVVLRNLTPELMEQVGIQCEEATVIFGHIDIPGCSYHDGVRFENGYELLLQRLPEGLEVDIVATSLSTAIVTEMVNAAEDEVRHPVLVTAHLG